MYTAAGILIQFIAVRATILDSKKFLDDIDATGNIANDVQVIKEFGISGDGSSVTASIKSEAGWHQVYGNNSPSTKLSGALLPHKSLGGHGQKYDKISYTDVDSVTCVFSPSLDSKYSYTINSGVTGPDNTPNSYLIYGGFYSDAAVKAFKYHVMPGLPPLALEALENSIMLAPSRNNDAVDGIVASFDTTGRFELLIIPASGVPDLHSVDLANQYTIMLTKSTYMFSAKDPSKFVGYRIANDTVSNPTLAFSMLGLSVSGAQTDISTFIIRKFKQTEVQLNALMTNSATGISITPRNYFDSDSGNRLIGASYATASLEGYSSEVSTHLGNGLGFGYAAGLNAAFTPRFASAMFIIKPDGTKSFEIRCYKNFDVPKYLDVSFYTEKSFDDSSRFPVTGLIDTTLATYMSLNTTRVYSWDADVLDSTSKTAEIINSMYGLFTDSYANSNVTIILSVPILGIDPDEKSYIKDSAIGWLHSDTKELAEIGSLYYAGEDVYDIEVAPGGTAIVTTNNIQKYTSVHNTRTENTFGSSVSVINASQGLQSGDTEVYYSFGSRIAAVNPVVYSTVVSSEDKIATLETKVSMLGAIVQKLLEATCSGDTSALCDTTWAVDTSTPDVLTPVGTTDVTTGSDGTVDSIPDTTGGGTSVLEIINEIKRTDGVQAGCTRVGPGGPNGIDRNSPGVGSEEGSIVWNYSHNVLDTAAVAERRHGLYDADTNTDVSTRTAISFGLDPHSLSSSIWLLPYGSPEYEEEFAKITGRPTLIQDRSLWFMPTPVDAIVYHLRYKASGFKTYDVYVYSTNFSTAKAGRWDINGHLFINLPVPYPSGVEYTVTVIETLVVKNELTNNGDIRDFPRYSGYQFGHAVTLTLTSEGIKTCYSHSSDGGLHLL